MGGNFPRGGNCPDTKENMAPDKNHCMMETFNEPAKIDIKITKVFKST